ncbi:MAG: glycosyltransferase [Alphaproteobacteria bacterium]|nr:glycosyltransferase [Alphaproteobacteria bacterium]
MNKNPEISIIIPVYNVQNYLEKCLGSVKNQTFQDWEAICVNDGSTDNSLEILQQYAEKDERFIVITQENQGLSPARNTGLEKTKGDYIMFLDGDDFLHPQCMELALRTIKDTDSDICQFKFKSVMLNEKVDSCFYEKIPYIERISDIFQKVISKEFKRSVVVWDKLYKSDLAKKITFKSVNPGEDALYTFELLDNTKIFSVLPVELIYYVQRPSSITHSIDKRKKYEKHILFIDEHIKIINKLIDKYKMQSDVVQKLQKYISERLFRAYILNAYKTKFGMGKIQENLLQLSDMVSKGDCNISLLRLRFRIMYYLLKHNHYYLAKLLV